MKKEKSKYESDKRGKNVKQSACCQYNFRYIPNLIADEKLLSAKCKLTTAYNKLAKEWSVSMNSEWIARIYLAAKRILQATVSINSMYYAKDVNLRIVVPYLKYYTFHSVINSIVFKL